MSLPGGLGYGTPTDPITALVRRIEDLERTQRQMNSQLVNNGDVAAKDGSGNLLSLAGIAFGLQAVSTAATFACAGNAVWRTDPLESGLTVTVSTGRLLIGVSAVAFTSVSAANAVMSWTVTDSHGSEVIHADSQRALVECCAGYPAAGYGSSSYFDLHTGLAAGQYTIRANYRCDQFGGTADTASFENRTVLAWPF